MRTDGEKTDIALATLDDTIAAIATAPGRGAVAMIRVSGPQAHAVVQRVARPWPDVSRRATRCVLVDERGERLDDAIVVRYDCPRSYTGEDLVEITTHGGAVVPVTVLAALVAAGAREALAGEFTRRAVLNGKLDLLQAEAVADLVNARWRSEQRAALAQLDGGLSRRVLALRDALLEIEALVAYDIDFPEEDDGPISRDRVLAAIDRTLHALDGLLATTRAGELVREGAVVVIAGAPNVGKSSLFNAILGRRRAIVTEIAGTTRDALEASIDGTRWPLRLVDTAGLRETSDVVERLGIEVGADYLRGADVVLACGEDDETRARAVAECRALTEAPVVAVRTKSDREGGGELRAAGSGLRASAVVPAPLAVSAETGAGIADLLEAIESTLDARVDVPAPDAPLLTRARHERAVRQAREELVSFRRAWDEKQVPATVAAVHLREAAGMLEALVGGIDVEDVLGRVFERFCVGK